MDPLTGLNGLFDILIDGEQIVKIGMCGSLDNMAMESAGMGAFGFEGASDEGVTEIDATGAWGRACSLQRSGIYIQRRYKDRHEGCDQRRLYQRCYDGKHRASYG